MEELEKRKVKKEFDLVNAILKEVQKQLKLFFHFKEQGRRVFEADEDAQNFVNKLLEIANLIKADKQERLAEIQKLGKNVDEEDMEYFEEDLEKVDKGFHHIMEISGFLMQNMGTEISGHIGATLLPLYAQVLLNHSERKDYELTDSVCMLCDCMEHGTDALFNQISA